MGIISFAKTRYIFTLKEIKEKKIVFHLSTVYFDKIFYEIFSKLSCSLQFLLAMTKCQLRGLNIKFRKSTKFYFSQICSTILIRVIALLELKYEYHY